MLKHWSALSAVIFLSWSAFAERIILKNASHVPAQARMVKTFSIGENRYSVVETAESVDSMVLASGADLAVPDLRVGLIDAKKNVAKKYKVARNEGWHIRRMKYDRIPRGLDGRGVIVAVIDTGVDVTHPALKDHLWKNSREIAGNGVDDDRNGYVDDINGYNFVEKNGEPADDYGHGTHCAGIIAGSPNRDKSAMGVAPGAQIMALRIIGSKESGFLSDAAEAVTYAVDHGARILSNSWRVYQSWHPEYDQKGADIMAEAIRYAQSRGVIFVAAAGNEGVNIDSLTDPMIPTSLLGHSNLFIVAATEASDRFAEYSNFGTGHVHVAAPGSEILSTVPGGKWESMSGTSMATPLVAGVLALGLQKGESVLGGAQKLLSTSLPISGWNQKIQSGGVIDLLKFLN